MALICTTPVLGFTTEVFTAPDSIPYFTGVEGSKSPQIGSTVDVVNDATGVSARYVLSATGWAPAA